MTPSVRALAWASLLAMTATATVAEEGHGHSHGRMEAVSFEGWEGTWQGIDGIIAHAAMIPVAETIASQAEGWTTSDVRNLLIDVRRDDFGAVRVGGDTITFHEDDALTVIREATYTTVEGGPIPNGPREVPITRAEMAEGEGQCDGYRYLAMIRVHGTQAGWHLRYGREGFAPLEVDAWGGWWASFTGMDITPEAYADSRKGVIRFLVEQVREIEPHGDWGARPYR